MIIIRTIAEMQKIASNWLGSIGFVPTMGYLHYGHLELVKASKNCCDKTIVSIFVNPAQFSPTEDLASYPRDLDRDIELLKELDVEYLFFPNQKEMYPDDFKTWVNVDDMTTILCGKSRPHHFKGVTTIVAKLINLVRPNFLFLGEKDYQQFLLIKNMTKAFFFDVNIIPCPTVRENDGLALSSRNLLLSAEERKIASKFPTILNSDKSIKDKISELTELGFRVDYLEERFERLFGAVYLGNIRLIDNVKNLCKMILKLRLLLLKMHFILLGKPLWKV